MKVFIEEQKFNQPLVIIALLIGFIIASITTVNKWNAISNDNISAKISSLSGIVIILLVIILFLFLKLKTRIDEMGIHYQFFPFHLSFKTIPWAQISKCYVRKYNALGEYGGWGLKYNFFKKRAKSFTTKGNIGLQLELKNGTKLLIGSQLKDSLQKTIKTYESKLL